MTTKHGGHLGYFEGGYVIPDHITWLDRVLVEYADAIADLCLHDNLNIATVSSLVPGDSNVEYRPTAIQLESNTSNSAGSSSVRKMTAVDKNVDKDESGRPNSGNKMPSQGLPRVSADRHNQDSKERNETIVAEGLLHQNAAIIQ